MQYPEEEFTNRSSEATNATSFLPSHLMEGLMATTAKTTQNNEMTSQRNEAIKAIQAHSGQIIAASGGVKLLRPNKVRTLLEKIGHPLSFNEVAPLRYALGKEGLNLPFIHLSGRRRFALHMVNCSDVEKGQVQTWLNNLNDSERRKLVFG